MIISIIGDMGGVGKTTSAIKLGKEFSNEGKKVLLVDTDEQGSLTLLSGFEETDDLKSIHELIKNDLNPKEVIKQLEDYDLIPSKFEFIELYREENEEKRIDNALDLVNKIKSVEDEYDYVLIDYPPNYLATFACELLKATDKFYRVTDNSDLAKVRKDHQLKAIESEIGKEIVFDRIIVIEK